MKNSYYYFRRARVSALWCLLYIVVMIAGGAWFVWAQMVNSGAALPLGLLTLTALYAAFSQAGETRRLLDQADRELAEEWRKVLRPRL